MRKVFGVVMAVGVAVCPVWAQGQSAGADLGATIAGLVAQPEVSRAHWGVMVTGLDGTPIYALNEGQFFQPASNAKLFTTAAAIDLLGPDKRFETKVIADGELGTNGVLRGNLVLKGGGDANFGGTDLPYIAPALRPKDTQPGVIKGDGTIADIEALADAVVAKGLREVQGNVVGDDTALSWEPIPPDWAADDLMWGYGAPVSALTIRHNQVDAYVGPSAESGGRAVIQVDPAVPYYSVTNRVFTTGTERNCGGRLFERVLGSKELVVTGEVAPKTVPCIEELAIDDPAEYAAMALKAALERRGVKVAGKVTVRHWNPGRLGGFSLPRGDGPDPMLQAYFSNRQMKMSKCEAQTVAGALPQTVLATHVSAPLIEDMTLTNKISQNLHAELFLRNIGAAFSCQPDQHESLRLVRDYLVHAGLDKDDFIFYDGSGLSGHDLVTPRATVKLLQFATTQPWFAQWKATLPVGGEDGSLRSRFGTAPLKDHVFAKTGTLGEARALSGYVDCSSGRTVIFSVMVTDHAPGSVDMKVMDRIVAAIATAE